MSYDLVEHVNNLKVHRQTFTLNPSSWAAFNYPHTLGWDWVKFDVDDITYVPDTRGVYAFVVDPDILNVFQHGYPMYIGETGDKNDRTLRVRYREYLENKRNIRRRPSIYYMLNLWGDYMYFYFAEIPDRRKRLKPLEEKLNNALLPPFSVGDFSAEVRALVRTSRL